MLSSPLRNLALIILVPISLPHGQIVLLYIAFSQVVCQLQMFQKSYLPIGCTTVLEIQTKLLTTVHRTACADAKSPVQVSRYWPQCIHRWVMPLVIDSSAYAKNSTSPASYMKQPEQQSRPMPSPQFYIVCVFALRDTSGSALRFPGSWVCAHLPAAHPRSHRGFPPARARL